MPREFEKLHKRQYYKQMKQREQFTQSVETLNAPHT